MPKTRKKPLTVQPAHKPGLNGSANGVASVKPTAVLRLPLWAWLGGVCGLLIALTAAGGLAYQHLSGQMLPGCGAGSVKTGNTGLELSVAKVQSACAALEAHPMGSLGGMWVGLKGLMGGKVVEKIAPVDAAWPVSMLAATYFLGALAAWLVIGKRGRAMPRTAVWLVRLGAAASLVYVGVIVQGKVSGTKDACPYCLASHLGNFALWLCMEIGMMKARTSLVGGAGGWKMDRSLVSVVAGAAVFVFATGVMAVPEARHLNRLLDDEKKASDAAMAALKDKMAADAANAAANPPAGEKAPWAATGFRGRWLLGPKESPVRVVLLTDFQCPDCRTFEGFAMEALNANPTQISLSLVHFPMCLDCNPHVSKTMHVNACKAARAAEAAAIMARNKASMEGGDEQAAANDMFFKMAKWLFEVKGDFDDAALQTQVKALGITDAGAFMNVMNGPKTLQLVQGDCKWGEVLGLYYTPMMFVNGVEVRGWLGNPGALTAAINAALAAKGPVMDARNDNPPLVGQKFREDWRLSPRMNIPAFPEKYVQGNPKAKVKVEIFGDLCEPNCKRVHELVQTWIGKKDFSYAFRYYPVDPTCNQGTPAMFPNACVALRTVEAAGIIGGPTAYFNMRDLVFQKQANITPNLLKMMWGVSGLDAAKFDELVGGPQATNAVAADVAIAKTVVGRSIPAVFVDARYVERWEREGDNVLESIIDEAIRDAEKKPAP